MDKKQKIFILIISIIFLSGCATQLQNIKQEQTLESLDGKSIVFGKTVFAVARGSRYYLRFNNVKDGKEYVIRVQDTPLLKKRKAEYKGIVEDAFYVELPEGDYNINTLHVEELLRWGMYITHFNPKINFTIPPNSIVYIGTLNYGFEQQRDYFFVKRGECHLAVIDDSKKATKELYDKYPNLTGNININLMNLPENNEDKATKVKF